MLTYNHEKYIRQAIDSILAQKTNFEYEILINDNASTDATIQILEEYKTKYPEKIRLILHEKNMHNKGIQDAYVRYLFPLTRGKYIAMNDGDDYWVDENKLQLEVDYLDKHPECSICFHTAQVTFDNDDCEPTIMPSERMDYTLYNLLEKNYMRVNSIMYRKVKGMFGMNFKGCYGVDWSMNIDAACFGEIGYINRVMSVWRRHENSVSWNAHKSIPDLLKEHWLGIIIRYFEERKLFSKNERARNITDSKIIVHLNALKHVGVRRRKKMYWILRLFLRFPVALLKVNSERKSRNE